MIRRRPNPENKRAGSTLPRSQRRMAWMAACVERSLRDPESMRALWKQMQAAWISAESLRRETGAR